MRVGFAGTPGFAAQTLAAMTAAGFDIALVLTRADRPKGRGLALAASPVKVLAQAHGIPVATPATLRNAADREPLVSVPLDVLVVAAYGLILPAEVLAWPTHGCINVHASLLPRWRGAAPIERAILAGDLETGVTLMQMDKGLDTGPMIERRAVPIGPRETAGTLHDKLAATGAAAIVETLQRLARDGALAAIPQPPHGATYATKIERADAAIDWRASAQAIDRQVRAFDPVPGAFTQLGRETWKVWSAEPRAHVAATPGTVLTAGAEIVVACGEGALAVRELQASGGKRLAAAALVAGRRIRAGDTFAAQQPDLSN